MEVVNVSKKMKIDGILNRKAVLEKGGFSLKTKEELMACLGPIGTFSETAAEGWKKEEGLKVRKLFCQNIIEVINKVKTGETKYGIVPVDNIYEGDVHSGIDLILETQVSTLWANDISQLYTILSE